MDDRSWRDRVYAAYVTSSQIVTVSDPTASLKHRAPYLEKLIRDHIPADRQTRIIDLGCGDGAALYFLKRAGYEQVAGVDVSAEQVERAHQMGLQEVVEGNLQSFIEQAKPASYDVVLVLDILEHLDRPTLFETLDQLHRILRPGGKLLAHVPNAEGFFGMRIRYGDITHENAFTPRSMYQVLTVVGFHEIHCYEDFPVTGSIKGLVRNILWRATTAVPRLMLTAETGHTRFVLSQNMLVSALKPTPE